MLPDPHLGLHDPDRPVPVRLRESPRRPRAEALRPAGTPDRGASARRRDRDFPQSLRPPRREVRREIFFEGKRGPERWRTGGGRAHGARRVLPDAAVPGHPRARVGHGHLSKKIFLFAFFFVLLFGFSFVSPRDPLLRPHAVRPQCDALVLVEDPVAVALVVFRGRHRLRPRLRGSRPTARPVRRRAPPDRRLRARVDHAARAPRPGGSRRRGARPARLDARRDALGHDRPHGRARRSSRPCASVRPRGPRATRTTGPGSCGSERREKSADGGDRLLEVLLFRPSRRRARLERVVPVGEEENTDIL